MSERQLDLERSQSLVRLVTRLKTSLSQRLAHVGGEVTPALKGALFQIEVEGCRTSTLAARLGVSKQAASKFARELEAMGLVRREPDPSDGRSSIIAFTDAGRDLVVETLEVNAAVEAELRAAMGEEAFAALKAHLTAVARRLDPEGF